MKFHLVRGSEIVGPLADCWRRIRAEEPTLDSPYFSVGFTTAVAAE